MAGFPLALETLPMQLRNHPGELSGWGVLSWGLSLDAAQ